MIHQLPNPYSAEDVAEGNLAYDLFIQIASSIKQFQAANPGLTDVAEMTALSMSARLAASCWGGIQDPFELAQRLAKFCEILQAVNPQKEGSVLSFERDRKNT